MRAGTAARLEKSSLTIDQWQVGTRDYIGRRGDSTQASG